MVVFVVSGLWHGADLTFILWGALHGIYMIVAIASAKLRKDVAKYIGLEKIPRIQKLMQIAATFTLVSFGWIFFRSDSVGDAFYIIRHLFDGVISFMMHLNDAGYLRSILGLFGVQQREFIIIIIALSILICVDFIKYHEIENEFILKQPMVMRWAAYYIAFTMILFFGAFNSSQTFIYFQF
jgi:alginate O-acetyltransferase complex protein AlgI